MTGHGEFDLEKRMAALEDAKMEISGRLPKGPFEFQEPEPDEKDIEVVKRFKRAVKRDRDYAMANGPYIRLRGMSQGIRAIYDGGLRLIYGKFK
jgi:hypothetical protein